MFNWNGKVSYVMTVMPDDTIPIDQVLDSQLVEKIYLHWDENEMGSLVDYGGGVRAITALMVREAGIEFLKTIKGIGPKRAGEILEVVRRVVGEVPYI